MSEIALEREEATTERWWYWGETPRTTISLWHLVTTMHRRKIREYYVCARCERNVGPLPERRGWKHQGGRYSGPSCGQKPIPVLRTPRSDPPLSTTERCPYDPTRPRPEDLPPGCAATDISMCVSCVLVKDSSHESRPDRKIF